MDPSKQDRSDHFGGVPTGTEGPTHANGQPEDNDRWLRSVLEHSTEIVKIVAPEGTLRYASPAFGRVLGYDPEEVFGMNVFDHVHPDDLSRVLKETEKTLSGEGEGMNVVEYRYRHKDGTWRWMEGVGTYLPDDPAVRGIVVNARDVTERKEAEERLRFQADLLEAVGQAIVAIDVEGMVLYWNRSAEQLYGWSEEEALGRKLMELVVSEDLWDKAEEIMNRLRAGRSWSGEFVAKRKDGSTVCAMITDTPVHNQRGELVGIIGVSADITERKEVEKALQESNRRYATLLANVPALVYRCLNEPGWPELFVSDYALELTGYPTGDLLVGGKVRYGDLIVEEDRQRVWDEVQAALREHKRFRLRYSIRRKGGTLRHVEEYGQGIYAEDGQVEAIEGLVYDVTEQVRLEQRLRDAEHKYRTLVERIPAVVYVQEPAQPSRTTYVSPQNEAILGYSPEECLADPDHWIKIMHPDDRERVLAEDERTNEIGESFAMEYRQIAKDGRTVWVRDEASLVRDEQGNPSYWLGVQFDVTERKRAERSLRESEQRFRSSFEDAAIGMALVATDGRWLRVNRSLCEIVGYPEEELLGTTFQEITHPDDLNIGSVHLRRLLAGEIRTTQIEKRYVHKEGHVVWVLLTVSLVHDEEGEPLYFVTQVQDVTERKKGEESLRRSEATLAEAQRIAHVGSWEWDVAANTVTWSDELYRIFGLTPDQFGNTYESFLRYVHPEDREFVRRTIQEAYETAQPFTFEHRLVRPDGSVRVLQARGEVIKDGDGETIKMTGVSQDVTTRRALEDKLEYQAFHDSLTELPNRQLFVNRLGQALERTRRRKGRKVAVLFMDLDDFKAVNDTLGHETGDELLKTVGERLQESLRPEDTLARFGGDEFTILIEEIEGYDEAVRVAERMIAALRGPFALNGRELFTRPSIGIALGDAHTKTAEDLLRDADTAMYRAKEEGSDYKVFDPAMYELAVSRLELENSLRRALEAEQFDVHYQPIISLYSGETWGLEALVRWNHPERGLLSPSEFVSIAEQSNLVIPVGESVLEETCRRAARWQEQHPKTPPLIASVNLSAKQLRNSDLVATIEKVLRDTGLEAHCLSLDITETAYIQALEANTAVLNELKSIGVRISIDDFGIGYSSLSYLKRLPADVLKVDRSFIKALGEDIEDTAIVRMIIELAHTLSMEVIAEGVEREEQAELLREMGCDFAQGFYFSEPLLPEEVPGFLGK